MKALVCKSPGIFEYRDIAREPLAGHHALIRVRRIGICGTDLHAFEGTQPVFEYPRLLGHELSGDLLEWQGEHAGFTPGARVTFVPYFNCGTCVACRNGTPNCCVTLNVCGVHSDGGMCEFLQVPIDKLIQSDLSYDELALVEPLAIGAHGVRRAGIKPGEFVLVAGAGPIGIGTMEFARIAGGKVIAMDINTDRLNFCRNQLHVQHTINANAPDVHEQLREITQGDMPTVVIDATGYLQAIDKAFTYLAHGGRYILIGLQRGTISIVHPEFHKREATLMSSRNAVRADFEHVIRCIERRDINPDTYITHRVPFDDLARDFASFLDPASKVIKAVTTID